MTFCELREKDIINIRDCKRLGRVSDSIFDPKNGCILSLITSAGDKLWGILGKDSECEIPWCKIRQIGPDIILVDADTVKKDSAREVLSRSFVFIFQGSVQSRYRLCQILLLFSCQGLLFFLFSSVRV